MSSANSIKLSATHAPEPLSFAALGPLPKDIFGPKDAPAEHTLLFAAAEDAPTPAVDPVAAQSQPDVDAGFKTVFVVGLNDKDKEKIKGVAANVQDYLTYLTGLTNAKVYEKITKGAIKSDDYGKQSDYRARLMQALLLNTTFMALDADVGFSHHFSCKTFELHTEILTALFKGLSVPSQVFGAFEGMFSNLKDSVVKFSSSSTVDKKHIFLIVKSFVKNDLNIVDTKIRIFLFSLSDEVKKITIGKSSYQQVDINIDYENAQYTWNDKVYLGVKESMDKALLAAGKKTMHDLPSVDVDV